MLLCNIIKSTYADAVKIACSATGYSEDGILSVQIHEDGTASVTFGVDYDETNRYNNLGEYTVYLTEWDLDNVEKAISRLKISLEKQKLQQP